MRSLIHAVLFRTRKLNACDMRARDETGDILSGRAPHNLLTQIVRDALGYQLEWKLPAFHFSVEPNDVPPIPGRNRFFSHLLRHQREQRPLEFRRGLSGCDLPQTAALRSRWAIRMQFCQFAKPFRIPPDLHEDSLRFIARNCVTSLILLPGGK